VLVPTFRRPRDLRRCLEGLAGQTRRPDRVLVVVRDDDHATHAALADVPEGLRVERIPVERPGQVAALNAGLRALREDFVAITDDDSVPKSDWLERIAGLFATDDAIGAVGGRDHVHHGDEPVTGAETTVGRVSWYGRFVAFHHLGVGPRRDVDFLKGVNMAYRRVALPGFDTALRGTGAEHLNDWAASLHVSSAGWRVVYDPAIAVDHYEGARDEDPRLSADRSVAADFIHNQTYAAFRYLPPHRAAIHLAFALAVGTTAAPGLALTLRNLLRDRSPRGAAAELVTTVRARCDGVVTGLRARREAAA
jgi:GT2 family glycosyltransferase